MLGQLYHRLHPQPGQDIESKHDNIPLPDICGLPKALLRQYKK